MRNQIPRDVDEKALFERFSDKYKFIQSDLLRKIERSNCGCDYGATSFATVEQVNKLGDLLELDPQKKTTRGWCRVGLARSLSGEENRLRRDFNRFTHRGPDYREGEGRCG